jgi:phosphate transport system protein
MLRSALEKEQDRLQNELLDLGSLVCHGILKSIEVLKKGDSDGAKLLIEADKELKRKRSGIELDVLVLIAGRQPVERDLRTLAAVLCIATELERIADYVKSNARNTITLETRPPAAILTEISRMAEQVSDMLDGALKAFNGGDVESARRIASEDPEKVDLMYELISRELMTKVCADPGSIESARNLMWVAHNLVRAADQTVNICKRAIFTVTGELKKLDGSNRGLPLAWPKGPPSSSHIHQNN